MSDFYAILLFRFSVILGGTMCIGFGCGLLRAMIASDASFKVKLFDAVPGILVCAVGVLLIAVAYFRMPSL